MQPFTTLTAIAVPMHEANIDTNQLCPTRFNKVPRGPKYREILFYDSRFRPDGTPTEFMLNAAPYDQSGIIVADRNFGCGSSREPAPKALRGFGFRAVIAPSFGGIFYNNCFRNGLLPVELPIEQVRVLAEQMEAAGGSAQVAVDLEAQTVTAPRGQVFPFHAPPELRRMLLEGLDEVGLTLSRAAEIAAFRTADSAKRPWVYRPGLS